MWVYGLTAILEEVGLWIYGHLGELGYMDLWPYGSRWVYGLANLQAGGSNFKCKSIVAVIAAAAAELVLPEI